LSDAKINLTLSTRRHSKVNMWAKEEFVFGLHLYTHTPDLALSSLYFVATSLNLSPALSRSIASRILDCFSQRMWRTCYPTCYILYILSIYINYRRYVQLLHYFIYRTHQLWYDKDWAICQWSQSKVILCHINTILNIKKITNSDFVKRGQTNVVHS